MRKYEVTLPDGRKVSRQYANQMKLKEENPEKYREQLKVKYKRNREKYLETQKQWLARFKEEHGMSYYKWRKENKKK